MTATEGEWAIPCKLNNLRYRFPESGRRRQDASAWAVKMYRVPPAVRWWPAVLAPLERWFRPQYRSVKHKLRVNACH